MTYSRVANAAAHQTPEPELALIRASAGLADCTWVAKFELQGTGVAGPLAPPAGCRIWKLARTRALVTCERRAGDLVADWVEGFEPGAVYSLDVSSVYADFLLLGPRSRDILSKLTSLDLRDSAVADGTCAQGSLAHSHCIVLREDRGGILAYHLLVARDVGMSVREALLLAGEEFQLASVGQRAAEGAESS